MIGLGLRRSMEETTTVTQTQDQTPPYLMTMMTTWPLSLVNNPHHAFKPPVVGLVLSLMFQGDLELESVFEHHGVCSEIITDSLERAIYEWCALVQPHPSALQLANKRKSSRLLSDLVAVFPPHTSGFALQVLDLTHSWSDRNADVIDLNNILALTAAVYMFTELNPSLPQQRYTRTLPELLTAVAELLTSTTLMTFQLCIQRGQSSTLPASSFTFWKSWGVELATPSPEAWIEIFRRLSLWQQQQLLQPPHLLAVPPAMLVALIRLPRPMSGASP